VQPYAFDILALDGEDLCKLPLSLRKSTFRIRIEHAHVGDGML